MPIVKETLDAIDAVSGAIDNIKTISEAIRDGIDYVKTQHPAVADDLAGMCEEMRKSSLALAAASSIVTHFRFVIGDSLSSEATRFNEHLIAYKSQAASVAQRLDAMRGHCSVIKKHADSIGAEAGKKGLKSLFAVFGLHAPEREKALAYALEGIYNEELDYHRNVYAMAAAITQSLAAVQDALGPPGMIDPDNIPAAASLLGEHAEAFAQLETRCNYNALALQTSIDELRTQVP